MPADVEGEQREPSTNRRALTPRATRTFVAVFVVIMTITAGSLIALVATRHRAKVRRGPVPTSASAPPGASSAPATR